MVYLDQGLEYFHETAIRNTGTKTPKYIEYGSGTSITSSDTELESAFLCKSLAWSQVGSNSLFEVTLLSTECNGSDINQIGLSATNIVGSTDLFLKDYSFISLKNNTFEIQVEGEIQIERGE